MTDSPIIQNLLTLPAELLQHILSHLGPIDLVNTARTCRPLHTAGCDEQLWQSLVNHNLPHPTRTSTSSKTFREIYAQHHPHWFLPRQALWFADSEPSGKLLIARYNPREGSIEAHAIVAQRGRPSITTWAQDPGVIIHSFHPRITLDLNQPVLKLDLDSTGPDDENKDTSGDADKSSSSRYGKEVLMKTFTEDGLYSSFMVCRKLPDAAISEQTLVWPNLRLPANSRTRNDTRDGFNSAGHRPSRLDEVSQDTFRLRKWVEYTGRRSSTKFTSPNGLSATMGLHGANFAPILDSIRGDGMSIRMPEDVTTFATLPKSAYTPTKEKPWQGIWCGDYSGHGCEFLVIRQLDSNDESPLPEGMNWLGNWFRNGRRRDSSSSTSSYASAQEHTGDLAPAQHAQQSADALANLMKAESQTGQLNGQVDDLDGVPTGRLEAIKLTGDPHIPRGEYTFIAPDVGPGGLLRVADEEIFKGARVVRSAGHIAGRGFRHDQYTPSQLIMVSHDKLAQFWEGFGHISYFQRVDLDALIRS